MNTTHQAGNPIHDTGLANVRRAGLVIASAFGLLLAAGCAQNPQTPTPIAAPVAQTPPPPKTEAEMGVPSATFVFLPSEPDRMWGLGTLSYQGKRYTFSAAGFSAARLGTSPGPIAGEIYHLNHLRDVNGTYSASLSSNGKEAVLKNPEGVTIHMLANSGVELGVETIKVKLAIKG